jgi:hypothetical protein
MYRLTFGRSLTPEQFGGRLQAVAEVCQRLENPGLLGTSVVGGPRTGKRSLLRYLASTAATKHLKVRATALRLFVEAQTIGQMGKPAQFWIGVFKGLEPLVQDNLKQLAADKRQRAASGKLDYFDLEDLFDELAKANTPAIVFVEDFELLLRNRHFWPPDDFFHIFRSLGQRNPRGLAFVISTPRPVLDFWDPTLGASPIYHNFITVYLGRLGTQEIRDFVRRAFDDAKLQSDPSAEEVVVKASDGHPCLVSALTDFYVNKLLQGETVTEEVVAEALLDRDGVYVTLTREIRAELSPIEREWLDKLEKDSNQLKEGQRTALRRLSEFGLLPPGINF